MAKAEQIFQHIDQLGLTLRYVEQTMGMPLNSLSRIRAGLRPLPRKHAVKLVPWLTEQVKAVGGSTVVSLLSAEEADRMIAIVLLSNESEAKKKDLLSRIASLSGISTLRQSGSEKLPPTASRCIEEVSCWAAAGESPVSSSEIEFMWSTCKGQSSPPNAKSFERFQQQVYIVTDGEFLEPEAKGATVERPSPSGPTEGSNAFFLRYGAWTFEEAERRKEL